MGWKEGKGLGKKETGDLECVQIRRREDGEGLGTKNPGSETFDWKDQWWNKSYNDAISKIKIVPRKKKQADTSSSSESSSDESSDDSSETPVLKSKPIKKDSKKKNWCLLRYISLK